MGRDFTIGITFSHIIIGLTLKFPPKIKNLGKITIFVKQWKSYAIVAKTVLQSANISQYKIFRKTLLMLLSAFPCFNKMLLF